MKQQLVFFVQDKIGGVTVLMHNIVAALDKLFDTSVVYLRDTQWVIKEASEYCPIEHHAKARISYFDKRKHLLTSLAKYVPGPEAIIVANDGLELEMTNFLQLHNRVVYVLHGDYDLYYDTAVHYEGVIDRFIVVSENIRRSLLAKLPRRASDIVYLKHIVPDHTVKAARENKELHLLFIGRLVEEKGFFDVIAIDKKIKLSGIEVKWTIVGDGIHTNNQWLNNEHVEWIDKISNEDLRGQLERFDVFVLPSKAEGFPVSLLEAMKAGVVPLVSHLPGAIDEVVQDGVAGYKNPVGSINDYVQQLVLLNENRGLLEQLSKNASVVAHKDFGAASSTNSYIDFFSDIPYSKKKFIPVARQRSFLELDIVPNNITRTVRKVKAILAGRQ